MALQGWGVARTLVAKEDAAAWHARNQGYEVFLPKYRDYIVARGRRLERIRCVFPGYLFVNIINHWYSLRGTRGIIDVIMAGDSPAMVPWEARVSDPHMCMSYLFERFDEGGTHKMSDGRFKPGQRVRVLVGRMRESEGVFESMLPGDRVRVLFEMMGRRVPVELGERELTAA